MLEFLVSFVYLCFDFHICVVFFFRSSKLVVFPFIFSLLFQFNLISHVLVFVCLCVRSFLYVVVSCVGSLCMCAMLRVEDHFWTKYTIDR